MHFIRHFLFLIKGFAEKNIWNHMVAVFVCEWSGERWKASSVIGLLEKLYYVKYGYCCTIYSVTGYGNIVLLNRCLILIFGIGQSNWPRTFVFLSSCMAGSKLCISLTSKVNSCPPVGLGSLHLGLNSSQFCSRSLFPLLSILPLRRSSQIITCKIVCYFAINSLISWTLKY
jgi:hypothetical protein